MTSFISFKQDVEKALGRALSDLGFEFKDLDIDLSAHADLESKVCFRFDDPPRAAKEVCGRIDRSELIGDVRAAGPYINFFVSRKFIEDVLRSVIRDGENYGSLNYRGKVILEHTSANPDGPLHVGHLRNAVIGDTLSRILRRSGYDVETHYYVNDMGRQISLAVVGARLFGLEDLKGDIAVSKAYISVGRKISEGEKELEENARELMKMYERGDKDAYESFRDVVGRCMDGIRQTLSTLGISHDKFVFESDFMFDGSISKVLDKLRSAGRIVERDGSIEVDLSDFGFEKNLVLVRSDGTTLYPLRDLAYHLKKGEECDRMIDIFGADHKLYSKQLLKTLELIGAKKPDVVIFEFVSLPEGSMSTREGRFISADDLIRWVEEEAYKEVSKRRDVDEEFKRRVARHVAIGAIRYDIVKVSPDKPTVFDLKEALDFEKQGAPFIQYSHARACSILRKAGSLPDSFDPSILTHEREESLIKKISMFPYWMDVCVRSLRPNYMAIYARELAEEFNLFYRDVPVLSAPEPLRSARLMLVDAARTVLKSVLNVLGIEPLESM